MASLGEYIREKREAKNLTQEHLASKIGIDRASVSFYESGRMKPKYLRMVKIAKVLQLDPKEWVGSYYASVDGLDNFRKIKIDDELHQYFSLITDNYRNLKTSERSKVKQNLESIIRKF